MFSKRSHSIQLNKKKTHSYVCLGNKKRRSYINGTIKLVTAVHIYIISRRQNKKLFISASSPHLLEAAVRLISI